jgi:hypothetical protein
MIKILNSKNIDLLEYIVINIFRSFNIIPKKINFITEKDFKNSIIFVFSLNSKQEKLIERISKKNKFKIIYLGAFSGYFLKKFNFKIIPLQKEFFKKKINNSKYDIKKLKVEYKTKYLFTRIKERFLNRFDFEKEWNNFGYGKISFNKNEIWSVKSFVFCLTKQSNIGKIRLKDRFITFVSVHNLNLSKILFVNRDAGLFDGFDVSIIEKFITSFDMSLPNFPRISEVPYEYDGLVTMRLDCDENIRSAKKIFNLYKLKKIPFSLAILTSILEEKDKNFIKSIVKSKGSILSHSHEHIENFGGNFKVALKQIKKSIKALKTIGIRSSYIVAPFHHTPNFIPNVLKKAKIKGIVGGIALDDYQNSLSFRTGFYEKNNKIILNNQQCMLHGDISPTLKKIEIYKKSFLISYLNQRAFGFLDHPFSKRYSYGWKNEEYRKTIHQKFIRFIKKKGKILFLSQNDFLNFLYYKSNLRIKEKKDSFSIIGKKFKNFNYSVLYKNKKFRMNHNFISIKK